MRHSPQQGLKQPVCEFRGMKKSCISLLAGILLGCSATPTGPATPAAGSHNASVDASAAESLKESDKCFPAVAWLEDTTNHVLWKGDRGAILKHFREQVAAGMKEITAVDVEQAEGKQICAGFVGTLPPAGPARDKVIAQYNEFWKSYLGSDASAEDLAEFQVKDEGQQYLDYNFDL